VTKPREYRGFNLTAMALTQSASYMSQKMHRIDSRGCPTLIVTPEGSKLRIATLGAYISKRGCRKGNGSYKLEIFFQRKKSSILPVGTRRLARQSSISLRPAVSNV
jgi:hypothetical protein